MGKFKSKIFFTHFNITNYCLQKWFFIDSDDFNILMDGSEEK